MKFMNPYKVKCDRCGVAQGHQPSRLLAYQASCVACGITLREAGRRMHHCLSQANAAHMQLALAMELEDAFGVSFNDDILTHEDNTLDEFLTNVVSQRPELVSRMAELRVHGVRFLEGSVHPSKADRVEHDSFYNLYASEPQSAAHAPTFL